MYAGMWTASRKELRKRANFLSTYGAIEILMRGERQCMSLGLRGGLPKRALKSAMNAGA